jgi:hypothetical protein
MAFSHSESTKWLATPVTCCCLITFLHKLHQICFFNVTGVSCSVTNTRTCICEKIRHFCTVKIQSDWQTQSHAVPYNFFAKITSNIYMQCNWNLMFSHKHQNMYLWKDTPFPHSENTKWLATPVTCCCLTTFLQKLHLIYICNVIGICANTRTCICEKIRHFRTVKIQSDWQPQSHAAALQFFCKKYILYIFAM